MVASAAAACVWLCARSFRIPRAFVADPRRGGDAEVGGMLVGRIGAVAHDPVRNAVGTEHCGAGQGVQAGEHFGAVRGPCSPSASVSSNWSNTTPRPCFSLSARAMCSSHSIRAPAAE